MANFLVGLWQRLSREKYLRDIEHYRQNYTAAPDRVKRLLEPVPSQAEAKALSAAELAAIARGLVDPTEIALLEREVTRKADEERLGTHTSFRAVTGPKNILYLQMAGVRSVENRDARLVNLYADLFEMYGCISSQTAADVKFMASKHVFKPSSEYVDSRNVGGIDFIDADNRYFLEYARSFTNQGLPQAIALLHDKVRTSQKKLRGSREAIVSRLIGECIVFGVFPDPRR